jgi:paraquat-inducible protein A
MNQDELIACRECDTLHRRQPLEKRAVARCTRCGSVLYGRVTDNLDRLLAVTLAALITFLIAQAFPIVELETNGITTATTLIGAIVILWSENMEVVAAMVFCSTILFPLTELCALLYVLGPVRAGFKPVGFNLVLRLIQAVRPWGMLEVFMLGVLVTLVKMASIARVLPEAALFAFGALTFLIAAVVSFDPRNLWRIAAELPQRTPPRPPWRRGHTSNAPRGPHHAPPHAPPPGGAPRNPASRS